MCFYSENCLHFGYSTSSFTFNLFTKSFHWVLQSFLGWGSENHLADFVAPLLTVKATLDRIRIESNFYARVTDILGLPSKETRNLERTEVPIFGIQVDTNFFTTRPSLNKIHKVCELAATALNTQSRTLLKEYTLTASCFFVPGWCV